MQPLDPTRVWPWPDQPYTGRPPVGGDISDPHVRAVRGTTYRGRTTGQIRRGRLLRRGTAILLVFTLITVVCVVAVLHAAGPLL